MKKHTLILLAAGSLIAFASCNSGENNTTKEQMDSTANARIDTMKADLSAKNDSVINAVAQMRADSMMRADSVAKLGAKKVGATTAKIGTKTVKPTKAATPVSHNVPTNVNDRPGGNGDSKDNNGKTIQNTNAPKNVNDRPGGN